MAVQLKHEVAFNILKHVPFKQRMQMCLVSKVFAAEAWAATDALWLQHTDTSTASLSLNNWINRHGSQLTSLRLEQQQYHWQLLNLPCPGLKSLQLGHVQVSLKLSQDGSFLRLLSAITGLTRLVLVNVAATDAFTDNLMALTALTALKQLEVDASGQGVDGAYSPWLLRLPSRLIPCLTQVTHLALHHAVIHPWALQQVSCLTALKSVSIDTSTARLRADAAVGVTFAAEDVLSAVEALHMLTALCLSGSCRLYGANFEQPLSTHTALRHLELRDFLAVDLGLLAPLTDLQHLVFSNTGFTDQAHTAQLLAWLAQLQGLTYLDLSGALTYRHPQTPAEAYSALTASSNLQHLDLTDCCLPGDEDVGVWQVVFASLKRLPHLTLLQLNRASPVLGSGSLHSMVCCCPALQELGMSGMGGYQWEVSAITALTGLTSFAGCVYQQRLATEVLPALTALRALQLILPPRELHRRSLMPLTQLRQLESLVVDAPFRCCQEPILTLRNRAPEGLPPDVWRQLRDRAEVQYSVANCAAFVLDAALWVGDTYPSLLKGGLLGMYYCALCTTGGMLYAVVWVPFALATFVVMYCRNRR